MENSKLNFADAVVLHALLVNLHVATINLKKAQDAVQTAMAKLVEDGRY